jgi:DNA-directed RNA polymerase subunit omega
MERIPERIDSTFRYVLIAAKRAEQLVRGARPKIEGGPAKPTRMAMQEVTQNLVDWDYGPPPMPEPEYVEEPLEETPAP